MICIFVRPSEGLIGAGGNVLGLANGEDDSVILNLRRCFVKISGDDFKIDYQKRARDFVINLFMLNKLSAEVFIFDPLFREMIDRNKQRAADGCVAATGVRGAVQQRSRAASRLCD